MKHLVLLLPLWLVFAVGEPSLAHPCPEHGMLAAHQMATAAHHQHGASGGHHAPQQAPAPHSHHDCSCISCCTPATAAVVPAAAALPRPRVTLAEPAAPSAYQQCARGDAHRVLPYANGPPA